MNTFDDRAATWDENPQRLELARTIANKIKDNMILSSSWMALDYGCGTGSLSFLLHDKLGNITLADDSEGMLTVLKKKISENEVANMFPVKLNLISDFHDKSYDLIYSMMTLHHIKETDHILQKFYSCLKTNGYLCIADLIEEDGSFHAEHADFDGHHGFNMNVLKNQILNTGFKECSFDIVYKMKREANGVIKEFPVFLVVAKK